MRKYDEEFKREAVKKVFDGQSAASVSRELGVAESLLHKWKREAVETGSGTEKEIIALKKRLRFGRDGARQLKKGGNYLLQKRIKRFEFVQAESANYPVTILCRVLRVSRSGFSAWRSRCGGDSNRQNSERQRRRERVKAVFQRH